MNVESQMRAELNGDRIREWRSQSRIKTDNLIGKRVLDHVLHRLEFPDPLKDTLFILLHLSWHFSFLSLVGWVMLPRRLLVPFEV